MVVHLSDELEQLVQRKVASGHYHSADEVISEALLTLEERDQGLDARAAAFQAEIDARLASGPATPLDFAAVKQRIRDEAQAGKGGRR